MTLILQVHFYSPNKTGEKEKELQYERTGIEELKWLYQNILSTDVLCVFSMSPGGNQVPKGLSSISTLAIN